MTTLQKIILSCIIAIALFATGRYTAPVKVETKVVETNTAKDDHKVIVITKRPDGTKVTTITDDTKVVSTVQQSATVTSTPQTPRGSASPINISLLAGTKDLTSLFYGISISKPLLGPFTIGVWGLSNLSGGVSLGVNL